MYMHLQRLKKKKRRRTEFTLFLLLLSVKMTHATPLQTTAHAHYNAIATITTLQKKKLFLHSTATHTVHHTLRRAYDGVSARP